MAEQTPQERRRQLRETLEEIQLENDTEEQEKISDKLECLERIESDVSKIRDYLSNWNIVFWVICIFGLLSLIKDFLKWIGVISP